MNFIITLLALTILIGIFSEAFSFQQRIICRQKAWLKGVEIATHSLTLEDLSLNTASILSCSIWLKGNKQGVLWRPGLAKQHTIDLNLRGNL